MSAARHSIVIPTRNRSSLLGRAIRSALRQQVDDLEVVVSDNASTDETASVVGAFGDERLRRVGTGRSLLMHDSWCFALRQARGELVTLLCDDDAIHPRALAIAEELLAADAELDVVFWRACTYRAADWFEPAMRRSVGFGPPCTDRAIDVDPGRLLDAALQMRLSGRTPLPLMLNCVVRRSLLERAAEAGTVLFRPSCPDYASTLGLAVHARGMCFVDAPLLVTGATAQSIGADALQRGRRARRFVEELLAGEPDLVMPPATLTPSCWRAQTFMQCVTEWPALAGRTVDLAHTYVHAAREIEQWRDAGVPVDDLDEGLREVLGQLGRDGERASRLIEAGVELETDEFIGVERGCAAMLGIGPFMVGDEAVTRRFDGVDEVAEALDDVLWADATPLGELWSSISAIAGAREIILYGLGANGRALARIGREAGERRPTILGHDDAVGALPPGVGAAPPPARWSPERQVVLVTPDAHDAIATRLEAAGFVARRDWFTPKQVVEAGTPSGCR